MIALFEAAKGSVVLAAGAGALSLLHRDAEKLAEHLVRHLQFDPSAHYAGIFIKLAGRVTDTDLWLVAAAALGYGGLRLVEAYGLWKARAWAEWLAVISGALYLPVEIFEIIRRVTWLRVSLFALNLIVVAYIAKLLIDAHRSESRGP